MYVDCCSIIYYFLCSSNLVPDEQSESNVNRPDYKVDVYQAYKYLYTNVYGEIKASKSISSSLLANDFCRITIFCKDALDQQKLNHTIGFQVTGKFLNKYYWPKLIDLLLD